jgi:threonine/homoserine/homoserine lactone efflux protein
MWSFALAALVLIMIPGPDQALVTRNALAGGRPAGMFTVIGGATGLTVHASAASFGVSALLLASATAFTVLKVVGTVYLIWMGIQTLREARRSKGSGAAAAVRKRRGSPLRYVRQGFLSNALNPKVALFFVTLLPQFMSADSSTLRRGLVLSGVFAILYLTWFSLYVLTVDLIGAQLRRPRVKAAIERVTGFLLVGFAVRLVLETN